MVKPEKCLHCGGEAQIYSHIVFEYRGEDYRKHWNGDKYYVRCESCGIQTQDYYTEQEAVTHGIAAPSLSNHRWCMDGG